MEMMADCIKLTREETGIELEAPFEILQQESIFSKYKFGQVGNNAPFKLFESNCSTSQDYDSDDESGDGKKGRGPYRKYTVEEKMRAVERVRYFLISVDFRLRHQTYFTIDWNSTKKLTQMEKERLLKKGRRWQTNRC